MPGKERALFIVFSHALEYEKRIGYLGECWLYREMDDVGLYNVDVVEVIP